MIRIDRTDLYYGGLVDVLLASWGRACAWGSAPMLCLAGVLAARAHRTAAPPVAARATLGGGSSSTSAASWC